MGRNTYLGGSTVVYASSQRSRRLNAKRGALADWVREAQDRSIELPEGIKLKPIQRFNAKIESTNRPKKLRKNKKKAMGRTSVNSSASKKRARKANTKAFLRDYFSGSSAQVRMRDGPKE